VLISFPSFAVVLFVSMSEKLIMTDFCLLSILGRTASINSFNVDSTSYIFYGLLFGSIIVTAIDNHRTYQVWRCRVGYLSLILSAPPSPPQTTNSTPISISKIITNILDDKKYFRFFWPASIGYGIIYAIISSMRNHPINSYNIIWPHKVCTYNCSLLYRPCRPIDNTHKLGCHFTSFSIGRS
jgi:hypothetical protein